MRALFRTFRALMRSRKAATAVEYGFLLALVVLAIMASLTTLGSTTIELWNGISTKVQKAG
jgi:pilus assembly protein Flp/PilA